jgi:hypothetical protein
MRDTRRGASSDTAIMSGGNYIGRAASGRCEQNTEMNNLLITLFSAVFFSSAGLDVAPIVAAYRVVGDATRLPSLLLKMKFGNGRLFADFVVALALVFEDEEEEAGPPSRSRVNSDRE